MKHICETCGFEWNGMASEILVKDIYGLVTCEICRSQRNLAGMDAEREAKQKWNREHITRKSMPVYNQEQDMIKKTIEK